MITRSKDGIFHRRVLCSTHYPLPKALVITWSLLESTCYYQASKSLEWWVVMSKEFRALQKQGTWSLVPPSKTTNLVGYKWVYHIKCHSDGSNKWLKGRHVSKGFHQWPSVDFTETFSSIVKLTTIRVVIILANHFGWPIHQLDIHNAFLHGILHDEVYMKQAPRFIDPQFPHHVCCLHKSIYDFKQAL